MRQSLGASPRVRRARSNGGVLAFVCASSIAFGLVACNALTGASDLATCDGCGLVGPGDEGGGGDGGASGDGSMVVVLTDGGADALPPTCTGSQTGCEGKVAAQCVNDAWVKTTCPKTCDATTGTCADYPSCRGGAGTSCVVAGATSCCDTASVPGGTFHRRNAAGSPATVSPFDLDKYEVTVGRMRAFVAAGGVTKLAPPATGAGALPKVPGSGWNPAWNVLLPADVPALHASFARPSATWTDQAGANENLPINNVTWFIALAFCAWDGGRLPTYAEMNFASAGGSEQRAYPWSVPPTDQTITRMRAAYDCNFTAPAQNCPVSSCSDATSSPCDTTTCIAPATCQYPSCSGCAFSDIAQVGSLPGGKGKWGHFDLSGNVAELVYDTDAPLPLPCVDCVHAPPTMFTGPGGKPQQKLNANFLVTGGGWDYASNSLLTTAFSTLRDDAVDNDVGFRCAR